MESTAKKETNPLYTPWGFALFVIPLGSSLWVVLRTILALSEGFTLAVLIGVVGVVTWRLTPSPTDINTTPQTAA